MMKNMRGLALGLAAVLLLSGCAEKEASRECFAMDTVMQLRAYGPQAAAALDAAVLNTLRQ